MPYEMYPCAVLPRLSPPGKSQGWRRVSFGLCPTQVAFIGCLPFFLSTAAPLVPASQRRGPSNSSRPSPPTVHGRLQLHDGRPRASNRHNDQAKDQLHTTADPTQTPPGHVDPKHLTHPSSPIPTLSSVCTTPGGPQQRRQVGDGGPPQCPMTPRWPPTPAARRWQSPPLQ